MNNESEIKISGKNNLRQWLTISMTLQVDCDGLGRLIAVQHQSTQFNPPSLQLIPNQSSLLLSAIFIPISFYLHYPQLKFDLISCLSEFFPCELSDEL